MVTLAYALLRKHALLHATGQFDPNHGLMDVARTLPLVLSVYLRQLLIPVGITGLYAPQSDLIRIPNWGRNLTVFSEDPLLAGTMAGAEVNGIQSKGLMAQVKHFAFYNGQNMDVVAQATKHGFLFVLNRQTGVPLWPVVERPVPQSDVPGQACLSGQ